MMRSAKHNGSRLNYALRSFGFKFTLLLVIFLALPVLLFVPFRNADNQRAELLLASVREQGRLIAEGIKPSLLAGDPIKNPRALQQNLARFTSNGLNVRILFSPAGKPESGGFYFVAAAPAVSGPYLEYVRSELTRIGVFERLAGTCQWDYQDSTRYSNPEGGDEILTSITPIVVPGGCWLVVTAHDSANFPVSAVNDPVWASPQIVAALAIYALMAAVIASLFAGLWRSLRRFAQLAHRIRIGGSANATFEDRNDIPELQGVAVAFDRMVQALQSSASGIRQAAEDNAHALKAPLAVIAQSIEPLRRIVPEDNVRGARALELIDRSVERLDALVSAARRMDEASAELVDPPRERIDLSGLVRRMAEAYRVPLAERKIRFADRIEPGLTVLAGEELLETVLENLVDNAASFSPLGSEIALSLVRDDASIVLKVDDRGPGVQDGDLERIFQRYVSIRQANTSNPGGAHFGIGLWIVRRNVEAIGGRIVARNRPSGGLSMIVTLPAVQ